MSIRVCFIGHREIYYPQVSQRLSDAIQTEIDTGCREFTMGTHGQFDSMALGKCKSFRDKYKDIYIEVVLTSYHKVAKKLLYVFEDEYGDKEEIYADTPYNDVNTIMYDIEELHFKKQITESNRQMIDGCDTMICYVDKKKYRSGAKKAMNYAKRKGLKIINLYDEKDDPTYGMTKEERKEYYDKLWEKIKNK